MKITFLVYNIYGIGGTVRTVVNTANSLAAAGEEVEIISVRKTASKSTFEIHRNVKLSPLFNTKVGIPNYSIKGRVMRILNKFPSVLINKSEDLYRMFSLYTDFMLIRQLKKLKSDVLITTIPSFNLLSAKYVNSKVIRIAQEHAQFDVHHKKLQKKIIKKYPKLDVLTVLTTKELDIYSSIFKDKDLEIKEVPNATTKTELRSSCEKKIIITAGRFVYEKGYERLIEAYVPIAEKYPDWQLRIFGSGYDYDLMRETINKHKLYNNVFLFPSSKKILEEFQKASFFVLPSRYESFGMVVIEAMSVGLPVISYNSYGPEKLIENDKDGFIVEMDCKEKFTGRMIELIEDEEKRKEMGVYALEKAEVYSETRICKMWIDIIKEKIN